MIALLVVVIVVSLALIAFLSLVETSALRLSQVFLRTLAEQEKERGLDLLDELASDRMQFLLPLQFALQVLVVLTAISVTKLVVSFEWPQPYAWALVIGVPVVSVFRHLIPRFLTQNAERMLLRLLPILSGGYRIMSVLSGPIHLLLRFGQKLLPFQKASLPEEPTEEAIQAYLDVGEEVGIFEEKESRLIQSALEFGTTLAREIMTPRNQIVAISDAATVSKLRDLIVSSKFSRVPVYRKNLEQIVGVVYVRNLLGFLIQGSGDQPITPLLKRAWFIPETKRVSDLLKEMQTNSEAMAFVVDEYGSVAGLVTIEDVLEEIVGEIYDEDEPQTVELRKEADGVFLVRGSVEIEDLEEELGVDLGEPTVTTVSGLVVDHLGEVPSIGQTISVGPLNVEILEANQKKINWMRVRLESEVPPEVSVPGSD
jgi:CBS domain containing-hemolysin-like protein